MRESDVTVTVTNWNGRRYLPSCLDAILAQTVPPAEVILVDNASDDGSVELVRERYPEVRVHRLERNDGPCPARNAGLEQAKTPWVMPVDNDAVLAPDCLERLLEHAAEGVAVVQPRAVFHDDRTRIHYDGADMHYVGTMTLHNFYAEVASAPAAPADVDAAISVALLMDRARVLEAGGYDPSHFILFEDHDLSYRLRSRGLRIVHVPAAVVFHREGTEGISFRESGRYSGRRVRFHSRNRWIVILKCHGWRAIVLGAPALLGYELAYLFFAAKNRCLGSWIAGKWDLARLLPRLLGQRRAVQRARRVRDRDLLRSRPLTTSPLIAKSSLVSRLQRGLDGFFAAWWRVVGPLT